MCDTNDASYVLLLEILSKRTFKKYVLSSGRINYAEWCIARGARSNLHPVTLSSAELPVHAAL